MSPAPTPPSGSSQPPVQPPQRTKGQVIPDRLYVLVPGLSAEDSRKLARIAVLYARQLAPKLSGAGANGIDVYWGTGFFGLRWRDPYLWYQESGTRPFTMAALAGKTIPMWIDDPTGKMHRDNPKAKTRITANGRRQVLIFRKAAPIGSRKSVVRRDKDGRLIVRDVPRSYPGAPGRITHREVVDYPELGTWKATGRIARLYMRSQAGVRWRHPGIAARHFMHNSILVTCQQYGLGTPEVRATYRRR